MTESTVQLQPAFILQHRKYRESSLILDVFTRDFGIVSILARGVRKPKSKTAGVLLAFHALNLSYIGKNELKILTYAEQCQNSSIKLKGIQLYCGFYINELVSYFLHKDDPYPDVFVEYEHCLNLLASGQNTEQVLRFFELNLMTSIGYGFQLSIDIKTDENVLSSKKYFFCDGVGMVESAIGYISGATLQSLERRKPLNKQALYEAKKLLRQVIDFQLKGKELKSRAILAKIIRQL